MNLWYRKIATVEINRTDCDQKDIIVITAKFGKHSIRGDSGERVSGDIVFSFHSRPIHSVH